MLARLLQAFVLAMALLALAGAAWFWQRQQPGWALTWLLLVLGLHAWVMAL